MASLKHEYTPRILDIQRKQEFHVKIKTKQADNSNLEKQTPYKEKENFKDTVNNLGI